MESNEILKPCPLCGVVPKVYCDLEAGGLGYISCRTLFCGFVGMFVGADEEDAIQVWNEGVEAYEREHNDK